ncbi:unnamed protein product [Periconia digitata]|uniref:Uncharacterized protein n=1 Tax=Periconia digitata TaxID=1303443 RepID=A0A9W4UM53_9PLEO|nr:unnamed protein product [Periconia digitata]
MAGPRNLPARSSQRRNVVPEEESPMQTRRGAKSAAKPEQPDIVSPRSSRHSMPVIEAPLTRKATRTISSVPNYAKLDSAPNVYATYESPFFMVFGLTSSFFDSLHLRKREQTLALGYPQDSEEEEEDEEEDDSSTVEEESDETPAVPTRPATTTRGRGGGRGSRGGRGRGRGGRGRGSRGGRGGSRGASARTTSPLRTRPSRNAAPVFPLQDHDDPSNQSSPLPDANDSLQGDEQDDQDQNQNHSSSLNRDGSDADGGDEGSLPDVKNPKSFSPATPPGSPPPGVIKAYHDPSTKIPTSLSVPKISLPDKASVNMSHDGTLTPAESAVPKLLDPEDDMLSDSDLPDAWIEGVPDPLEAECEDRADYLLQTRYKPMPNVQDIIDNLQKHSFTLRSTESLYALAENTQMILRAWQDQYLELDAKTAPHAHPPKKACNGGRIPMAHQQFEDRKEASLYGYVFDPKKPPGMQDPFAQRPGHEKTGRRELRQRRTRDMLDSAAPSEEEEEEDQESRPAKRQRRATRPFEVSEQGNNTGTGTGTNTPKKKNNGWGGARKKGVSKYAQPAVSATATPEPEGRGKRGKAFAAAVHHRIQAMREESAVVSSSDEGGSSNVASVDTEDTPPPVQKRGRPAGSKNVARRSDFGQKKGPRKKVHEEEIAMTTSSPNGQPQMLQSMSEGQGQFTIDAPVAPQLAPSLMGPHSTETVFQATPQPLGVTDPSNHPSSVKAQPPDFYTNATPLSQYNTVYMDDSATNSASGSKGKPRVKSEKRSQSMTIWWAERKARRKEMEEKTGTPIKAPPSRSNSTSGRRGGRPPNSSKPPSEAHSRPQSSHQDMSPHLYAQQNAHPDLYAVPHDQHPPPPRGPFSSSHSPTEYSFSAYPPGAPPPNLVSTPLAALPTSSAQPPPPPSAGTSPSSISAQGRTLAPAPHHPHLPAAYPSPFGPRAPAAGGRPKNTGPMPLAPAPLASSSAGSSQHVSPYPPLQHPPPERDSVFKSGLADQPELMRKLKELRDAGARERDAEREKGRERDGGGGGGGEWVD